MDIQVYQSQRLNQTIEPTLNKLNQPLDSLQPTFWWYVSRFDSFKLLGVHSNEKLKFTLDMYAQTW